MLPGGANTRAGEIAISAIRAHLVAIDAGYGTVTAGTAAANGTPAIPADVLYIRTAAPSLPANADQVAGDGNRSAAVSAVTRFTFVSGTTPTAGQIPVGVWADAQPTAHSFTTATVTTGGLTATGTVSGNTVTVTMTGTAFAAGTWVVGLSSTGAATANRTIDAATKNYVVATANTHLSPATVTFTIAGTGTAFLSDLVITLTEPSLAPTAHAFTTDSATNGGMTATGTVSGNTITVTMTGSAFADGAWVVGLSSAGAATAERTIDTATKDYVVAAANTHLTPPTVTFTIAGTGTAFLTDLVVTLTPP
jgi:predicted small integral membrane protein